MPSGEQRLVLSRCMATIGVLSNPQAGPHKSIVSLWALRIPGWNHVTAGAQ